MKFEDIPTEVKYGPQDCAICDVPVGRDRIFELTHGGVTVLCEDCFEKQQAEEQASLDSPELQERIEAFKSERPDKVAQWREDLFEAHSEWLGLEDTDVRKSIIEDLLNEDLTYYLSQTHPGAAYYKLGSTEE